MFFEETETKVIIKCRKCVLNLISNKKLHIYPYKWKSMLFSSPEEEDMFIQTLISTYVSTRHYYP
jgi:hypothetical protein